MLGEAGSGARVVATIHQHRKLLRTKAETRTAWPGTSQETSQGVVGFMQFEGFGS